MPKAARLATPVPVIGPVAAVPVEAVEHAPEAPLELAGEVRKLMMAGRAGAISSWPAQSCSPTTTS